MAGPSGIGALRSHQKRVCLPISVRAYREIFDALTEPGFSNVSVGENGEIDLRGIKLICGKMTADQRVCP